MEFFCLDLCAEHKLLDACWLTVDWGMVRCAGQGMSFGLSIYDEQPTQNWGGQWESDCLIKTKHCDDLKWWWHNVISAQCSECQCDEI